MVREIYENELSKLLNLYLYLHEKSVPERTEHLKTTWETIIKDKNHHIIVNEADNKIVSSCVCVIIPNLTRNVRPYAFIENVVTRKDCRGRGYATECLNYAKEIAKMENCYKIQRKSQYLSFIEAQGITAVIKPLLFNGLNRTIFRLSKKQHMATVLV